MKKDYTSPYNFEVSSRLILSNDLYIENHLLATKPKKNSIT